MCVHIYIYIYMEREREIHIHIYIYIYVYIHTYTYTYIHTYIKKYTLVIVFMITGPPAPRRGAGSPIQLYNCAYMYTISISL